MRARWTISLSAALGLCLTGAYADEVRWRPVADPPAVATPGAAARPPAVTLGRPIAALGRPVPLDAAGNAGPPATLGPIVRCQAPDAGPPPVPPPGVPAVPGLAPPVPGDDLYNHGPVGPGPAGTGGFWTKTGEIFGFGNANCGRSYLQSDHAFDGFSSPVTNPSEFEDPRALTEFRPVFIYQKVPGSNPFVPKANIETMNLQGRVAFTDRLSLVLNQFGFIHLDPGSGHTFQDTTGLTEIELGPKFTFWRGESTGTVGAVGLTFDLPVGPRKVFQDTGTLTLRPYVSLAQNFLHTSYGSFDAMTTLGYNFSTDSSRSDNLFSSWHLDFNVANANKIYPFLELNWRHYTANGKVRDINFEGGDLFNLGAEHVAGHDTATIGPGVRYKFTEWAQIGTAVEFPLLKRKDLEDFRWTIDLIFRY